MDSKKKKTRSHTKRHNMHKKKHRKESKSSSEHHKSSSKKTTQLTYPTLKKEFCRLCLKKIESIPKPIWGDFDEMPKMIMACCSVKVLKSDKFKSLCFTCATCLEEAHNFREMCIESNSIFKQLNGKKKIEEFTNMGYTSATLEEIKEEDEFLYKLKIKNEINHNTDSVEIESVLSVKKESSESKFSTDIPEDDNILSNKNDCVEIDFPEYEDMENGSETDIKDEYLDGGSEDIMPAYSEPKVTKEYPCVSCPKICYDSTEFSIHKNSHTAKVIENKYYCSAFGCAEEFKDKKGILLHRKTSNHFSYCICEYCGKLIKQNFINTHIYRHLNRKWCAECKTSVSFGGYWEHKRIRHSNSGPMQCPKCEKKLKNGRMLYRHIRNVHTSLEKIVCEICNKEFSCKYNLRGHMRSHTGEMPFRCPDCHQEFRHRVTMKQHRLQVHNVNMFNRPPEQVLATIKGRCKKNAPSPQYYNM